MSILGKITEEKLVAIARGITPDCLDRLIPALDRGGIHCIEVTYDQSSNTSINTTLECIRLINEKYGDLMLVGAGTVLTPKQVRMALDAGAKYIISPNVSEAVISETKKLGAVSMPGAMTPTEACLAWECGADIIKLFPSGAMGLEYFKALRSPLKHIPFMAVGGITPENLPDYMKAGAIGAGIGGNLINLKNIHEGRYDLIEAAARAFREAVEKG